MKITLTLQDKPDGGVEVISNPSFETMAQMINSGHDISSAQAYALTAINAIKKASKNQDPASNLIYIPKVKRI